MKKMILRTVLCSGLAVFAAACSESDFAGPDTAGTGGFKPDVALNSEIITGSRPKAPARAEAADITAADLGLRLVDTEGATVKTWDKLADFDPEQRFNVGDYTLEAFYGDGESEGFEAPWFLGSQKIKIEENKVTPVAITATLANSMVSLDYTEAFTSYMTSYDAEVHSAAGSTTAVAAGEVRPVYVKAGLVEIYVNFTKPNGKGAKILSASFTAKPRHHYHVTFDMANGAGDAVLKVIYDDMLDLEEREIDLSDELLNLPSPEITAEGFTSGEAISFVPGFAPEGQLKVNIIAQGKLARVNMTTRSASLLSQGWPAEINLVGAAAQSGTLAALGMQARGLYTNPDKMAVIDLTGVLGHITLVEGSDGITEITFKVVDAYGKASDDLTLRLENAPLAVSLSNPSPVYVGASEMEVDLAYNGGNPDGAVTIEYFNDRGTWTKAQATFAAVSEGLFRATVTGLPADARDIQLRAITGSLVSETVTVERTPVAIAATVSDNDVFARHASIGASLGTRAAGIDIAALLRKGTLMISSDGGATFAPATATVDGSAYNVTGLAPATGYKARIEIPGVENSNEIAFTTESEAQLPGFTPGYYTDVFTKTTLGIGETNIKCWHPGTQSDNYWSTRNPRTTGQTSGTTYYYTSYSGTLPMGTGAEISTLGYGEGTTYAHMGSGKVGDPKKKIGGLLFTGDYSVNGDNETISAGRPFTSRPTTLSFKYKFVEVNGESFRATIVLENRAGGTVTEIGRGSFTSSEAKGSFTPCEIPVTYTESPLKATHISVMFESTTSDSPQVLSRQGSKGAFKGYSDSKYIGTQLTVDDIELIY